MVIDVTINNSRTTVEQTLVNEMHPPLTSTHLRLLLKELVLPRTRIRSQPYVNCGSRLQLPNKNLSVDGH